MGGGGGGEAAFARWRRRSGVVYVRNNSSGARSLGLGGRDTPTGTPHHTAPHAPTMAAAKKDVKKETGLALKHKKVSRRRRARRAVPRWRRPLCFCGSAVVSCALIAAPSGACPPPREARTRHQRATRRLPRRDDDEAPIIVRPP